jgi:hypothetical protein
MSSSKKISVNSGSAAHSSLSIFTTPPTNVSINKAQFREILPMNSIEEQPFEFRIFSDNQWLDIKNVFLYTELSIQKKSGANWVSIEAADTNVALINNVGQALIRQLTLHLNGTEIFDSSNLYGYLTYIKTVLNYSDDVKNSLLGASGYYDEFKIDNAEDDGFKNRVEQTEEGKICEFISRLDFDLANQPLFLLNNIDVLFTIYRADDAFLIQTLKAGDTNTYRVKLHSLKIYVKMIDVQSSVNLGVMQMLAKVPAKYPTRRMEIRTCYISSNRTEMTYQAFSNVLPRKLIVTLVNHNSYRGSQKLSPWNFKPFNLRDIIVNANGLNYPAVNYNMKYTGNQKNFIRAYMDMIMNTLNTENTTNGITINQFLNGWNFYIIPMNSTMDDCCGYDLIRNGTTTIQLVFNDLIPAEGLTMIVIGEFDQLLQIDQSRIVLTDTSI